VVVDGRFANNAGFLGLRFVSEFSAAHLCRTGNDGEIVRRYDRNAAARRNGVRWLMMARNLFDLAPSQPGYWQAQSRAVQLAAERGLYAEPCLFADAQMVMPNRDDRRALVRDYAAWCRAHVSVVPQLSNEPAANASIRRCSNSWICSRRNTGHATSRLGIRPMSCKWKVESRSRADSSRWRRAAGSWCCMAIVQRTADGSHGGSIT
jgi:hypothetical protein